MALRLEPGFCTFSSSCPPPALVKEILSNVQRLTFYGFLVALSKHHGINQTLGKQSSCDLCVPPNTVAAGHRGRCGPARVGHCL